jgi:hypothetical protein
LYAAFKEWATESDEAVIDERKFSKVVATSGIAGKRTAEGRMWLGIKLAEGSDVA